MAKDAENERKRRPTRILFTLPLAETNDAEQLGVSGGVPLGMVYVEDRPMGPSKWPGGLLVGNMRKVFSETGHNKSRSMMCRFIAREFFPRPVFRARWPAVLAAARDRASANGTTPEREILDATAQAIAFVRQEDVVTSPELSFERLVSRRINEIVTEDFLGPEWRRQFPGEAQTVQEIRSGYGVHHSQKSDEDIILTRQFGREIIARAKLSPGEAAVLGAVVDDQLIEDWASRQGIASSTARNALSRARKKIRKVMA